MAKNRYPQITKVGIDKLRQKGWTITEIARKLCVTPTTIRARIAGGWSNLPARTKKNTVPVNCTTAQPSEFPNSAVNQPEEKSTDLVILVKNGQGVLCSVDSEAIHLSHSEISTRLGSDIIEHLRTLATVIKNIMT